ncbi:MAG: hypothetical protein QMD53_06695 [Actinomycetota bacterium]|nr:hypothetical protein [Actinomycetota bacterium]
MSDKGWFMESVRLTRATALPTKEEMERVLPAPLPPQWQITKLHNLTDGGYTVTLGHLNPLPSEGEEFYQALAENPYVGAIEAAALANQMEGVLAVSGMDMTPGSGEYDYYANLGISEHPDKEAARQSFENIKGAPGPDAEVAPPGLPAGFSLGEILEAFAPKELAEEAKKALGEYQKSLAVSGVGHEEGKFLDEEALFLIGQNGERVCQTVLVNNFVIMGDILACSKLPQGEKPVHSVQCQMARKNLTLSPDRPLMYGMAAKRSNRSIRLANAPIVKPTQNAQPCKRKASLTLRRRSPFFLGYSRG